MLLTLCVMLAMLSTTAFAASAVPSKTNFVMDGKPVSVTAAYSINGTNYLQLRAIAAMLNGTSAQFDVGWDGQYAVIEPGKSYSGTITETRLQNTTNVRQSSTKFKLNGNVFTFSDARLVDGNTNYIQLREFAQKLTGTASQFNVYWDSAAGQAVIQPGVAYTGNPPAGSGATSTGSTSAPKPKGGTKRTIDMEGLLTLEISNAYSYARIQGVAVDGVTIVHFVVVPEGATIKCTKYVPPFDSEYWAESHYFSMTFGRIVFDNGIQPSIIPPDNNINTKIREIKW